MPPEINSLGLKIESVESNDPQIGNLQVVVQDENFRVKENSGGTRLNHQRKLENLIENSKPGLEGFFRGQGLPGYFQRRIPESYQQKTHVNSTIGPFIAGSFPSID